MKTSADRSVSHQRGSTNVYADLGYKSAGEMIVKARRFVTTIAGILAERRLYPRPRLQRYWAFRSPSYRRCCAANSAASLSAN